MQECYKYFALILVDLAPPSPAFHPFYFYIYSYVQKKLEYLGFPEKLTKKGTENRDRPGQEP